MFYRRRRLQLLFSLLVIVGCSTYLAGLIFASEPVPQKRSEAGVFTWAWKAIKRDFHRPIDERAALRALAERTREHWVDTWARETTELPDYVEPTPYDVEKALLRFQLFLSRLDAVAGPDAQRSADYVALDTVSEVLGDPYAAAFDPEQHARYLGALEQSHTVGLGLAFEAQASSFLVVAVWPDSPAQRAGIEPGDLLAEWDGRPLSVRGAAGPSAKAPTGDAARELTVTELDHGLNSGEPGTAVSLVFLRNGDRFRRTLEREVLAPPTVTVRRLPGREEVGLISVHGFHDRTLSGVLDAWDRLSGEGVIGTVLDLRDCTGGYLVASLQLASLFLDSGTPVVIIDSQGEKTVRYAVGGAPRRGPLMVLVNERTASAAEVLASALQQHHRALVVGQPTFGKGSVQKLTTLSDGGAYKFTTANYRTPSGDSLEGVGLQPDLLLETQSGDDSKLWTEVAKATETTWTRTEK